MSTVRDGGADDPRRARADRATAAERRTYLTVASLLLADAAITSVIGYLSLPPDVHLAVHLSAGRPTAMPAAPSPFSRCRSLSSSCW